MVQVVAGIFIYVNHDESIWIVGMNADQLLWFDLIIKLASYLYYAGMKVMYTQQQYNIIRMSEQEWVFSDDKKISQDNVCILSHTEINITMTIVLSWFMILIYITLVLIVIFIERIWTQS